MGKREFLIVIIAVTIVGAVTLYVTSFLWFFPHLHDKTLNVFSQRLFSTPLPENTQEIERINKVGLQSGNSDHCDYLAALLLKTALSKSDIEKYYENNYKGDSQLHFYWVNELYVPGIGVVNPTNIFTLDDWVNNKSKISGANLILFIFEGAMTSAFDFRCS